MEKDDLLKDDFIGRLIKDSSPEQPSDGFVDNVMEKIRMDPEMAQVRQPYYVILRSVIPYLILALICALIFFTSDLPFLNWLPGKEYWSNTFLPYFEMIFSGVKNALSSKYVSMGILIGFSVLFLIFIDHIMMKRKGSFRHHTLV
ncbi:MAG: hypothetical protein M0P58_07920 [Bacteroidales bacterium]|nr:hypothetical protein [Bacteroidales bacterium]